jgi:hypothetical protein
MHNKADLILSAPGDVLPPCTAYHQNRFLVLRGGAGVDDQIYVGFKLAGGTYAWAKIIVSGRDAVVNGLEINGTLDHDGSTVGFYATAPASKQAVTGSRGGNAALASLLTALSTIGLITNSSTA